MQASNVARDVARDAQQAARDAQEAAREVAREARQAAQEARDAAREAGRAAQQSADDALREANAPVQRTDAYGPGTIVIPTDGPEPDIRISVDGGGIHVQQGDNSTTLPIHDVVPRGAVQIAWAIPATLSILLIWWPLSRAVIGWLRRKTAVAQDSAALEARLAGRMETLERNIDTVAVEMERLAEGQRFTNKLLADRQRDAVPVARAGQG